MTLSLWDTTHVRDAIHSLKQTDIQKTGAKLMAGTLNRELSRNRI